MVIDNCMWIVNFCSFFIPQFNLCIYMHVILTWAMSAFPLQVNHSGMCEHVWMYYMHYAHSKVCVVHSMHPQQCVKFHSPLQVQAVVQN